MLEYYNEDGNVDYVYDGAYLYVYYARYNKNKTFHCYWVDAFDVYCYIFGTLYDILKVKKTSSSVRYSFDHLPDVDISTARQYISSNKYCWNEVGRWFYGVVAGSWYSSTFDKTITLSDNIDLTLRIYFEKISNNGDGIYVYKSNYYGYAYVESRLYFMANINKLYITASNVGTYYVYTGESYQDAYEKSRSSSNNYDFSHSHYGSSDRRTDEFDIDNRNAVYIKSDTSSSSIIRIEKIEISGWRTV